MCFFIITKGQSNYTQAMQQGDDAFNNQEYKKAISKYFAAEAFDPGKKDLVKAKVNKVFDRIEQLKKEAEKARIEADTAKNKVVRSAAQTQIALDKAQKLIRTFYFYNNRFALAYKNFGVSRSNIMLFKFYFIDQNGDGVEKLGQWNEAGPFKESGFARVKGGDIDYIVDTLGHTYTSVYNIKNMDSGILALDIPNAGLYTFPDEIAGFHQLNVLILNGSNFRRNNLDTLPEKINQLKNLENLQLSYCGIYKLPPQIGALINLTNLNLEENNLISLPSEIGELKNLKSLNISKNKLNSLPPQIVELKNLTSLYLDGNNIPKTEIAKIRKLLPKCYISY
jgi:hypothetical protein